MSRIRSAAVLLAFLLLIVSAVSCADGGVQEGPDTDPVPDVQTEQPDIPDTAEPVLAGDAELGFEPVWAEVTEGTAVSVGTDSGKTSITPLNEGSSRVTFFNSYGEKAYADVTVGAGFAVSAVYERFVRPEHSASVTDFGAVPGSGEDSTDAFTSAIDSVSSAGGGTVYVPAGNYRINSIQIKGGVALRLEGYLPDAGTGYTEEIAEYVASGRAAVISSIDKPKRSIFIYNTPLPVGYCTEGTSDFTVSGGVFECGAKRMIASLFCGSNITFEGIIVKDLPNNHAFQIDGCTDVRLNNIMFAGYAFPETDGKLTRETIQLEPTLPGSLASNPDNSPVKCEEGDYHFNSCISITGCYFGKSDKYGSQLTAIGHHSGKAGTACRGLTIKDNVFDNPLYCAIRIPNITDTVIAGNTFISEGGNGHGRLGEDSALVSLVSYSGDTRYTASDGSEVVFAYPFEQTGLRGITIEDNVFRIGDGSPLRAGYVEGASAAHRMDAVYAKNDSLFRAEKYGGELRPVNGYFIRTNTAYDITVRANTIEFTGVPDYSDCFVSLKNVIGFFCEDNRTDNAAGAQFTAESVIGKGISADDTVITDRRIMLSRSVSLLSSGTAEVRVESGDGTFTVPAPLENCSFTLFPGDGGTVELETGTDGSLTVRLVPDEGYVFSGFTDRADGTPFDLSQPLEESAEIDAVFTAK